MLLHGMTRDELADVLAGWGQPAFRAGQLFHWLQRGVGYAQMSNLPAPLRQRLADCAPQQPVQVAQALRSGLDGTVKLLYRLADEHMVEGVLMRYKHGNTLCVSTQVGCAMGCTFCASTLEGCARNLHAGEMIGQVQCANAMLAGDSPVHNVVLMGSGEPLDNYEQTVRFLRLLRDPDGLCIGLRNVSLSTCGLVPQMRRFAREGLPVTLSVSLHAPNDTIRRTLMPVARANPMETLLDACRDYIAQTGRRVIMEYALIHGVNCAPPHADELAARLRGMQCHVNLIPLNAVAERGLRGAGAAEVRAFQQRLLSRGVSVTLRREMGGDLQGACGQLRRRYMQQGDASPADPSLAKEE
ncbi:MAG: 23S rRNA (adenine(2503)-C(2))-methyltransferase RlmN [Oscillospiraceae bacterium]|jgi:23S rRNA (adenine2503-C2)-methyltransferase|nr:23S rRNA (adenine(2503)-C(2))-methyltransferase RlmN [Oscillospiraceae bacterium]